jgi:hypothetical protein
VHPLKFHAGVDVDVVSIVVAVHQKTLSSLPIHKGAPKCIGSEQNVLDTPSMHFSESEATEAK